MFASVATSDASSVLHGGVLVANGLGQRIPLDDVFGSYVGLFVVDQDLVLLRRRIPLAFEFLHELLHVRIEAFEAHPAKGQVLAHGVASLHQELAPINQ